MKYRKLIPGDIMYYKNIPEFLSGVQRKILDTEYSHCSLISGHLINVNYDFPMCNTEFEADIKVRIHHLKNNEEIDPKYREVFRFRSVPTEIMDTVLTEIIEEFDGEVYAFIQWLSIGIRRLSEIVGYENAKAWNLFWGWSRTVVCSELLYYFVKRIAEEMIKLLKNKEKNIIDEVFGSTGLMILNVWKDLLKELNTFNPNLFHPKDLGIIQRKYKLIWDKIV
jgi:hypothetical protein